MASGILKTKLRPFRLAFLVQPSDKAAITAAIETASFLWGGMFNPIIPVYDKLPKFWERDTKRGFTAHSVLEGYLDAFDPDAIVKVGALETKNLEFGHRVVIKCSEITASVEKDGTPEYGIGMFELLQHLYEKELKFVRQQPLRICLPEIGSRHRLFFKSVFGAFSAEIEKQFQQSWLKEIPGLESKKCTLDNYAGFLSPDNLFLRRLGTLGIQQFRPRSFRRRDCIFFLDANSHLDILDYWNLRALGWNVMPVCQQAASNVNLLQNAAEYVEENSFAFRGNPNMFNDTMLLKSRTVPAAALVKFGQSLKLNPAKHPHENKITYNFSYPRIWDEWAREKDEADLPELEVEKKDYEIPDGSKAVSFRSLMPEFAAKHGSGRAPRCANEIKLGIWTDDFLPAEIVPEGDEKLAQAAGGSSISAWRCAKSGLVYLPHYKDWRESLSLVPAESVFLEWLRARQWQAEISDKGHIARQMLKQLGGKFWITLLAKAGVVELLKKLSDKKPIHAEAFRSEVAKIVSKNKFSTTDALMQRLVGTRIGAKIVQAGLQVQCPSCRQHSWFSVKEADYELRCPICLEHFQLPTDNLKEIDWAYRTIGAFALPLQAYGVYAGLITLHFFTRLLDGATTPILNFIAKKGTTSIEVDLGLFFQRSKYHSSPTELIFAECKTFNQFEQKDADRMLLLAKEFPGAVLVFATLNKSLTEKEKILLKPVVNRGRRYWKAERPYNPVLILTGNELLADKEPRKVWQALGGIHATHSQMHGDERGLVSLADATHQIYLGMKPWRESVRARQKAGRRKQNPIPVGSLTGGSPKPVETIVLSFPVAMKQVPWR